MFAKLLLDETLGQLKEWIYGKKSCNSGFVNCWTAGDAKGQLISKCPFGVIVWTKIPTKIFPGFLP